MKYISLAVFILITALAASTGAQFETGPWYEALAKPSFTPPNWVFPIAWTALYALIAVAGWRVWLALGMSKAVVIWGVGLFFNALWSYLMFGLHRIDWALADLGAMLVSIVAFMATAWAIDRPAVLLFVPYLLWVLFAGVLNAELLRLNG